MSRYKLTRSAERDIRDIWDYVAAENFETADTLLDRFYARFLQVAGNPRLGSVHPEIEGDVRFVVVGQYVILYKAIEKGVLVLRVLHGRRDISQVFRDEPFDEEETD